VNRLANGTASRSEWTTTVGESFVTWGGDGSIALLPTSSTARRATLRYGIANPGLLDSARFQAGIADGGIVSAQNSACQDWVK
jgi:hypothetical protein